MKKLFALVLLLPLLSGCLALESRKNPITKKDLYALETALAVSLSGLNSYRRLCVAKMIDQKCRTVIVQIQSHTKPIPVYMVTLRRFVKDNDQVNALTVFNTVLQLLADSKQIAQMNGVRM